jgi:SAM-dependent methyltransferase
MRPSTRALLACPECRGNLSADGAVLVCASCGARYEETERAAKLLPRPAGEPIWHDWSAKQELGLAEYEQEEERSDPLAALFGEFADLRGVVLDIGCGIGRLPEYARAAELDGYVGLDPLNGRHEHDFDFIQGLGERLPIRDTVVDRVVCATSLDHVVDADGVIAEARRVLKPDGALAVWIGVLDEDTLLQPWRPSLDPIGALRAGGLRQLAGHLWYWALAAPVRRLGLRRRFRRDPEGIVRENFADRMRYHFHFFRPQQLEELLARCGFEVARRRLIKDPQRGSSLFVFARPATGPR